MTRDKKIVLTLITGMIMTLIFWSIHLYTRATEISDLSNAQEIIIKYDPSTKDNWLGDAKKTIVEKKNNLYLKEKINKDWALYQIDGSRNINAEISELKKESVIDNVQINYHYQPLSLPNDTDFSKQWALKNTGQTINDVSGISGSDLNIDPAWNLEKSNWSQSKVAIIDAGFSANYNDTDDNIDTFYSFDFTTNDYLDFDITDPAGTHGAQIASILGSKSNNGVALSGVSYFNNIKLMLLKTDFTTAELVSAINYAGANGAKVINASWGCLDDGGISSYSCSTNKNYNDVALREAIDNFSGLFVTAAGNKIIEETNTPNNHDSGGSHVFPCDFDSTNIICVAATDQNDQLAIFSDFGANSVDVAAPGTNIYVPDSSNEVTLFSEDFSSATPPEIGNHLTKEGSNNSWGTVDMSEINALWSDYTNTPYLNNQSESVKTDVINMAPDIYFSGKIDFNISCDTEPRDPGWTDYVMMSVWNGSSWQEVDRYDEEKLGDELFHPIESDLTPYLNSQMQIKFTWITNSVNNDHLGCAIWPITVTANQSHNFSYKSGTSYSTAYVSGLAGLLWSANPILTKEVVKGAIISSGDEKLSLLDKTVSGKRINYYNTLNPFVGTIPIIDIASTINGAEILDRSIKVFYTVDGETKSKTFSGLSVGANNLSISETSPVNPSLTNTKSITVYFKEPLNLSTNRFSAGWNMISFADLSAAVTNNTLLPGTFKIRGFNGASNNYTKGENETIGLIPGSGYWIKIDDINKINGLRYAQNEQSTAEVSISKGWNLLGNPFQSDLPLANLVIKYKNGSTKSYADAISSKEVSGYGWSWEASSKEYFFIAINPDKHKTAAHKQTVVNSFRGFWMIVKSDQISSIIMNK